MRFCSFFGKLKEIVKGCKEDIPKQCTSFVSSIGIDEIKRQNKWEICDLLIGYRNCISKKIKLAGVIGKKKDMSIRLRISRVLQIILSTY